MSLPSFGDLYKPIKDVLTKSYCGESQKLEVTAKADAVKFSPNFARDASGNISASFSVEGDYTPCKHAKAKLKYGVSDKGVLNTKLTVDSMPKAKGLKLECNADLAIGAELSKDKFDLKAEYKNEKATLIASVKQDLTGEVSCVCAVQELQLGGQVNLNLKDQSKLSHKLGAAYKVNKTTTLACLLENRTRTTGGISTNINGWLWAGEYSVNVNGSDGLMTLGLETSTKDGQTFKAKVNTKGAAGVAVVQKLSPQLKLTSSVEVEGGKASKWGATLAWES